MLKKTHYYGTMEDRTEWGKNGQNKLISRMATVKMKGNSIKRKYNI